MWKLSFYKKLPHLSEGYSNSIHVPINIMRYMMYIHSSGATLRSLKRGNLQTSFLPHRTSAWAIPLSWGMSTIIRIPEKDVNHHEYHQ